MDKDEWISLERFAEQASDKELLETLKKAQNVRPMITTSEGRSELRRILRLLEDELLARQGLSSRRQGQR